MITLALVWCEAGDPAVPNKDQTHLSVCICAETTFSKIDLVHLGAANITLSGCTMISTAKLNYVYQKHKILMALNVRVEEKNGKRRECSDQNC